MVLEVSQSNQGELVARRISRKHLACGTIMLLNPGCPLNHEH